MSRYGVLRGYLRLGLILTDGLLFLYDITMSSITIGETDTAYLILLSGNNICLLLLRQEFATKSKIGSKLLVHLIEMSIQNITAESVSSLHFLLD